MQYLSELLKVGGIAGIIAVVITMTICTKYLQQDVTDFPEILTHALSTILGFYFGAGVAKGGSSGDNSN